MAQIALVWLLQAYLILITSNSVQSEGSLFSRMPFVKLDGNILQAIAVPNILQCCWKCDRLLECLSLNVADVPDKDGLYECQMLRTETNKYSGLLKPSQGYHHYTRFMDNCAKCLNEGTCHCGGYYDFWCECLGNLCNVKDKWLKINTSPVCFGAMNSSYGSFYIKEDGTVTTVKLVHRSGYVSCVHHASRRSNWGCGTETLNIIITDSTNQKILQDKYTYYPGLAYSIPGINSRSKELNFDNFNSPMAVTAGQEYRIWYGEDFTNSAEVDNEGTTCVDVYMFGMFD